VSQGFDDASQGLALLQTDESPVSGDPEAKLNRISSTRHCKMLAMLPTGAILVSLEPVSQSIGASGIVKPDNHGQVLR
jgi:hypothetical protein